MQGAEIMTDNMARVLAVIAMLMAMTNELVSYRDHVRFEKRIAALEARK